MSIKRQHPVTDETAKEMKAVMKSLEDKLSTIKAGKAVPAFLESILVDAYGVKTPLQRLGSVTAPEARLFLVQLWDASLAGAVEKAIGQQAGLNPITEGATLRVPVPALTSERRTKIVRDIKIYCEEFRISIRGIRRKSLEEIDRMIDKEKTLSQDEGNLLKKDIQKLADQYARSIDEHMMQKEEEILTV